MGFAWAIRDFVRGRVGLSGLVKDVGESVSKSKEAIRQFALFR